MPKDCAFLYAELVEELAPKNVSIDLICCLFKIFSISKMLKMYHKKLLVTLAIKINTNIRFTAFSSNAIIQVELHIKQRVKQ